MSDTTARYGLIYPTPDDLVRDGAAAIQALAEDVEAAAWAQFDTVYTTTAAAIANATGWNLSDVTIVRRGPVAHIRGSATRTGAAITVPANGNLGNVHLADITASLPAPGELLWFPIPAILTSIGSAAGGRLANFTVRPDGSSIALHLSAVATSANIANGETLSYAGVFVVGNTSPIVPAP